MKKAERSDANKTLFVPKLRVKLSKFTMAKAPASTKRGCRKKDASPRLVAMPEFPSVSSPREHSIPKNPCGAVPRGLRIPTVSLPNLPPLPKFPTVSLPSLTSLPRIPTVAIPTMPSLPTIPEIEAILATPFQFVASVWPTCLNPSNIFTRSSEGNAASSSSDGEATGSRACNSFSAQSLFNFSASSLRFPSAFKLYELALLKSFGSPDTKNDDQSDKDQVDCTNLAKKRRTEETADLNANELTSDQMTKMLSDFLSNCNCDAKAKLLHQLVEQKSKSEELDKCYLHCSSSEESLCKICMESPMDCVLLECGHIVSCLKCGSQLTQCPICREVVVRVVRTFRS